MGEGKDEHSRSGSSKSSELVRGVVAMEGKVVVTLLQRICAFFFLSECGL